jgi:hypothetical protein
MGRAKFGWMFFECFQELFEHLIDVFERDVEFNPDAFKRAKLLRGKDLSKGLKDSFDGISGP